MIMIIPMVNNDNDNTDGLVGHNALWEHISCDDVLVDNILVLTLQDLGGMAVFRQHDFEESSLGSDGSKLAGIYKFRGRWIQEGWLGWVAALGDREGLELGEQQF